jgi:hypothetical protein
VGSYFISVFNEKFLSKLEIPLGLSRMILNRQTSSKIQLAFEKNAK